MDVKRILRRLKHHLSSPKNFIAFLKILSRFVVGSTLRNSRYFINKTFHIHKIEKKYLVKYKEMSDEFQSKNNKMSTFWKEIALNMKKEMIGKGLHNFRREYSDRHFAIEPSEMSIQEYYDKIKKTDKYGILGNIADPLIGNPDYKMIEGKAITYDLLQSAEELIKILSMTGWKLTEKVSICEIGGGYGRLAYLIGQMMPNAKYTLVDLPETLIIAYYFLSKSTTKKSFEKQYTFYLTHEIKKMKAKSVDLFLNIDSFQEMTPEIIKDYFNDIDRIGKSYFYTKNKLVDNNTVDNVVVKIDEYPFTKRMKIVKQGIWEANPMLKEMFIKLK